MDKMLAGNYEDDIDEEQYTSPRVTKEEMRDVMIEALFSLYFEPLDITQWNKDKDLTFQTDPMYADNVDYYQAVKRLNNPLQSYTTPKKIKEIKSISFLLFPKLPPPTRFSLKQ